MCRPRHRDLKSAVEPRGGCLTKTIKRQVAVGLVVAVEKASFLMAVNEAVRGVEVEDDDLAFAWDGGDALLEDEVLNFPGISLELFVTGGTARGTEFEPIEGGFSCQGDALIERVFTAGASQIGLSTSCREQRIVAQLIVIIEVFVAQGEAQNTLLEESLQWVLNEFLVARIVETSREFLENPHRASRLAQEKHATVGREETSREIRDDFAALKTLKFEGLLFTDCLSWSEGHDRGCCLITQALAQFLSPLQLSLGEKSGLACSALHTSAQQS